MAGAGASDEAAGAGSGAKVGPTTEIKLGAACSCRAPRTCNPEEKNKHTIKTAAGTNAGRTISANYEQNGNALRSIALFAFVYERLNLLTSR